jgi:hypothetical protein
MLKDLSNPFCGLGRFKLSFAIDAVHFGLDTRLHGFTTKHRVTASCRLRLVMIGSGVVLKVTRDQYPPAPSGFAVDPCVEDLAAHYFNAVSNPTSLLKNAYSHGHPGSVGIWHRS